MKNWKTILGIFLIFAFGLLTGALVAGAVAKRYLDHTIAGGPDVIRQMVVQRLSHQLSLNSDQQVQVATIVTSAQKEIQAARMEIQPRVTGSLKRAVSQIRDILTPEQAVKFDVIANKGWEKLSHFDAEPKSQ